MAIYRLYLSHKRFTVHVQDDFGVDKTILKASSFQGRSSETNFRSWRTVAYILKRRELRRSPAWYPLSVWRYRSRNLPLLRVDIAKQIFHPDGQFWMSCRTENRVDFQLLTHLPSSKSTLQRRWIAILWNSPRFRTTSFPNIFFAAFLTILVTSSLHSSTHHCTSVCRFYFQNIILSKYHIIIR